MKIKRAYKYRLYPTADQESRLLAWVVAVRTVYNAALEQRKKVRPTQRHGSVLSQELQWPAPR